jgi:ABC-2 type transport system permease protein
VLADRSVFSLFILAPLLYGVFYPQPYLGQLLRKAPVAIVDHDHSELSRSLVQTLDAHEAIEVAVRADTLAEAQQALFDRRVFAILDIPIDTEREVLKGNEARLPAYVDATYFIAFNRTLQGVVESAAVATTELLTHGGRADSSLSQAGLTALSPVELLTEPLFNPTGGYASYVVPAAFVLIIQQTLLMGAAMLGGVAYETGGPQARSMRGSASAVLGQALAHLCLYVPALGLYLIILPRVYGFSTLGRPLDLLLFAVPVILATSCLGQAAGAWFKHRETAVILFIATSLPQFFLVGVSWPAEAVPQILRSVGRIFPSESAIDGLVRINQMGASLHEVSRDWAILWGLAAIYFLLTTLSLRRGAGFSHAD